MKHPSVLTCEIFPSLPSRFNIVRAYSELGPLERESVLMEHVGWWRRVELRTEVIDSELSEPRST